MKLSAAAAVILGLLGIAWAGPAGAATYKVFELPTPSGYTKCFAQRINDSGQIVGTCQAAAYNTFAKAYFERAVVWDSAGVHLLEVPPGLGVSQAASIASTGEIVGFAAYYATLWINGQEQTLGLLSNTSSAQAVDVNASGVILGFCDRHVVEWVGSNIVDFGVPFNAGMSAIDAQGLFVGHGVIQDGDTGGPIIHGASPGAPFRYLDQSGGGEARAINDRGEVAGFDTAVLGSTAMAWTWHAGRFVYLPDLPRTNYCVANCINLMGIVVGKCGGGLAVLWKKGSVEDLNAASGHDKNWQLLDAMSINSSGEIVGDGTYRYVPEPFLLMPEQSRRSKLIRTEDSHG